MELNFAHPYFLLAMCVLFPIILLIKIYVFRPKVYRYPLTSFLRGSGVSGSSLKGPIMFLLRAIIIGLSILLISRLQWVDRIDEVKVNGIDIVLALDLSGSMDFVDDLKDPRSRLFVAKNEAINFVKRRLDDQISIVIFGSNSMTVSPLTFDKVMLERVISRLAIGDVDPISTNLSEGLALSVARLKDSKAKSKIIVLLTDGQPTGTTQVSMERAIQLAKEFEIKVYTIAVGNSDCAYAIAGPGHIQRVNGQSIDHELLEKIAKSTGGIPFVAQNPAAMEEAYRQIDLLEKTERQSNNYFSYSDIFWPIASVILILIFIESVLLGWLWRGLW